MRSHLVVIKSKVHSVLMVSLMLLSFGVQAGVSVFPNQVMLGEPVILVITGENIEADFEKFDKDLIRQSFEIFDIDGDSDRLRLTLYPRKSGQIPFPAMRQGKIQFNGAIVVVDENPDVSVAWTRPRSSAFVQQFELWTADVRVAKSAFELTLEKHPHFNKKVTHQFEPLAVATSGHLSGKTETLVMAVSGEKPGRLKVRSPVVKVKHSGQRPWLFFDDTQYIDLKPLPSYLPSFLPVGEASIEASPLDFWLAEGRLYQWNLKVKGQNLLISTLPDITSQFFADPAIEWLTPDVKKRQRMAEDGLTSELVFQQPFRISEFGFYKLPTLKVTFFNPETGKLADDYLPGHWVVSVPIWVLVILQALLFMVVLLLIGSILMSLYQWLSKMRLIMLLRNAKNNREIWQAIEKWSESNLITPVSNVSFGQWQKLVENQLGQGLQTAELVKVLNEVEFSQLSPELELLAIEWAGRLPNFQLKSFVLVTRRLLVKLANRVSVFFNRND